MESSIEKLKELLNHRQDLKNALETSLVAAAQPGIGSVEDFYDFLHQMLTYIPTKSEINTNEEKFYYLISRSTDDQLKKSPEFNQWITSYAKEVGAYMDTLDSAKRLDTFIDDPDYKIGDYYQLPGGWQSFNQFVARKIKAGKRPVADRCNDKITVSTTDSVYLGQWPVKDAAVITKGTNYSVIDLLDGSPYQDKFREGIFTHSYLDLNDYHHFHTPIGGVVREVRVIPGNTILNVMGKEDGKLEDIDGVDFQFTQTRGLLVLETIIGFVAVLAVGMGHVSSVTLTVDKGDTVAKGEDFGYFAFGGSDMVMLFEAGRVQFTAEENKHYLQGEAIAHAV